MGETMYGDIRTKATYAIRFSHTARRCSDAIASPLGVAKFCIGGGGRNCETAESKGLEGISGDGLGDGLGMTELDDEVVVTVPLRGAIEAGRS